MMTFVAKISISFLYLIFLLPRLESEVLINNQIYHKIDTTIVENINVSDIFLSIRFDYIVGDTVKSTNLRRQQEMFLREQNMPISGAEEIQFDRYNDFEDLDKNYKSKLKELAGHEYRNLYRQVCSQILAKYYCANDVTSKFDLNYAGNKLKYYLEEMKDTRTINVALIYASLIKLQCNNHSYVSCNSINEYLIFTKNIITEEKNDLENFSKSMENDDDVLLQFMLKMMDSNHLLNKKYLEKIGEIRKEICINK